MQIRLGYVAMSMNLENCSPSRTATVTVLDKLEDIAAIKKEELKISYCAHCGTKINENDKICSQCGSNLQNKK